MDDLREPCYKTVWPTPKPKANTLSCLTTSPLHRVCNRAITAAMRDAVTEGVATKTDIGGL